jgi:hypothetical protein
MLDEVCMDIWATSINHYDFVDYQAENVEQAFALASSAFHEARPEVEITSIAITLRRSPQWPEPTRRELPKRQ